MKKWGAGLLLAAALCVAPLGTGEAAPNLPDNIFQWVQSTARQSYYFNKSQMCYGVKPDGYIDLNKLIVPTVHMYDSVQIQDVISKRRWNGLPLSGYTQLVGRADYLEFDLAANTVQVTEHVDLDNNFGTLFDEKFKAGEGVIDLSKLSEKDVDGKFYRAVIDYAAAHQDELIGHTKGILSKEDDLRIHTPPMTPEQLLEFQRDQERAIARAERKVRKTQAAAEKARKAADEAEQKAQKAEEEAAKAAGELAVMQAAAGNSNSGN